MLTSIFNNEAIELTIESLIICIITSIILGAFVSFTYSKSIKCSKPLLNSLTILPLLVSVVVMMVNGNLGTGIAILGAFSLVKFRSVPGTSREIVAVFFSMTLGLAIGMGQILFSFIICICGCLLVFVLSKISFGIKEQKKLKIVIPEDLDYNGVFDEIFEKYLEKSELVKTKTTNMGTMYELVYVIEEKKDINEKELIDAIRTKNGNLKIVINELKEHDL